MDVFTHPDIWLHDTGRGVFEAPASPLLSEPEVHPESAARLRNVKAILERGSLSNFVLWREGRHAQAEELELVHDRPYIDFLRRAAETGRVLSRTTPVGPGSWPAALAAVGCSIDAAEAALTDGRPTYALVRPPGHHAQPGSADGYCLCNNIAIAAERLRARGVERIAIIDWDVHHGNGTQECFYNRADVLTISLHERHGSWGPWHPQTGSPLEKGLGEGAGYNVNVELPYGAGDAAYSQVMGDLVTPIVDAYRPSVILVAAGQDANQFDPNGRQCLTMAGFYALGKSARSLADRHCGGRLALIQEGGYAVSYTAFCAHATLAGVLGVPIGLEDPLAYLPDDTQAGCTAVASSKDVLLPYWPELASQ